MRLKLTVQYDGTAYHGWQAQEGLPTIEGALLEAFRQLIDEDVELVAAGRTDAGVHAWGQVCHADVTKEMELFKYRTGLNHYLPPQIRVSEVEVAAPDFHARYDAVARHYRYVLWNGRTLRPDLLGHAGHVPLPLDGVAMGEAVRNFPLGEHDFSGYRDAECQSRTPLCTLLHFALREVEPQLWHLDISADHFLHHMVRNVVGTLVEIGQGKRGVNGLCEVLDGRDRTLAGPTFGADGLYLRDVSYK